MPVRTKGPKRHRYLEVFAEMSLIAYTRSSFVGLDNTEEQLSAPGAGLGTGAENPPVTT